MKKKKTKFTKLIPFLVEYITYKHAQYIEIENKSRGKIKISTDGEFALKIFSIYYGLSELKLKLF